MVGMGRKRRDLRYLRVDVPRAHLAGEGYLTAPHIVAYLMESCHRIEDVIIARAGPRRPYRRLIAVSCCPLAMYSAPCGPLSERNQPAG
jgi:hypothetical protein